MYGIILVTMTNNVEIMQNVICKQYHLKFRLINNVYNVNKDIIMYIIINVYNLANNINNMWQAINKFVLNIVKASFGHN